jgi:hypothetical protein
MSFGTSVGDFITVGKLVRQAYQLWNDAPDSFKNISSEVLSLHALLNEVDETLSGQPLSRSQQARLATIRSGCDSILRDLQSIVERHKSLGSLNKRARDRLTWPSGDIGELRGRLTSNTALIGAFMR